METSVSSAGATGEWRLLKTWYRQNQEPTHSLPHSYSAIPVLTTAGGPCHTSNMTTLTIDHSSTALDNALRHVRADHEAVMIEQDGHVIAVLVPPEEYLPVKDADIPAEFWQGLRESKAGIGVDMETALNEPPPGV